jgi:hypothetical protein
VKSADIQIPNRFGVFTVREDSNAVLKVVTNVSEECAVPMNPK